MLHQIFGSDLVNLSSGYNVCKDTTEKKNRFLFLGLLVVEGKYAKVYIHAKRCTINLCAPLFCSHRIPYLLGPTHSTPFYTVHAHVTTPLSACFCWYSKFIGLNNLNSYCVWSIRERKYFFYSSIHKISHVCVGDGFCFSHCQGVVVQVKSKDSKNQCVIVADKIKNLSQPVRHADNCFPSQYLFSLVIILYFLIILTFTFQNFWCLVSLWKD